MKPRYAVYFVPAAQSALYRFGAAFIGYDCYSGTEVAFPGALPLSEPAWREFTREPRRYGFHATLKAPFHLADGADESSLFRAFHEFCRSCAEAASLTPTIASIDGFIAVVPSAHEPEIDRLAAACVTAFDRFRAPLDAHDRNRRLAAGLTTRQVDHLARWGYPYVFEDFRLHLTLTGRLPAEHQGAVLSHLRNAFSALAGAALKIDRIALLRQDRPDGRFVVLEDATIGAPVP